MRLHSVTDAITNSSSELFVVTGGDLRAACEELEGYWVAWQDALSCDDPWKDVFRDGEYLYGLDEVSSPEGDLDALSVPYAVPREFRDLLKTVPLRWSEYFDG